MLSDLDSITHSSTIRRSGRSLKTHSPLLEELRAISSIKPSSPQVNSVKLPAPNSNAPKLTTSRPPSPMLQSPRVIEVGTMPFLAVAVDSNDSRIISSIKHSPPQSNLLKSPMLQSQSLPHSPMLGSSPRQLDTGVLPLLSVDSNSLMSPKAKSPALILEDPHAASSIKHSTSHGSLFKPQMSRPCSPLHQSPRVLEVGTIPNLAVAVESSGLHSQYSDAIAHEALHSALNEITGKFCVLFHEKKTSSILKLMEFFNQSDSLKLQRAIGSVRFPDGTLKVFDVDAPAESVFPFIVAHANFREVIEDVFESCERDLQIYHRDRKLGTSNSSSLNYYLTALQMKDHGNLCLTRVEESLGRIKVGKTATFYAKLVQTSNILDSCLRLKSHVDIKGNCIRCPRFFCIVPRHYSNGIPIKNFRCGGLFPMITEMIKLYESNAAAKVFDDSGAEDSSSQSVSLYALSDVTLEPCSTSLNISLYDLRHWAHSAVTFSLTSIYAALVIARLTPRTMELSLTKEQVGQFQGLLKHFYKFLSARIRDLYPKDSFFPTMLRLARDGFNMEFVGSLQPDDIRSDYAEVAAMISGADNEKRMSEILGEMRIESGANITSWNHKSPASVDTDLSPPLTFSSKKATPSEPHSVGSDVGTGSSSSSFRRRKLRSTLAMADLKRSLKPSAGGGINLDQKVKFLPHAQSRDLSLSSPSAAVLALSSMTSFSLDHGPEISSFSEADVVVTAHTPIRMNPLDGIDLHQDVSPNEKTFDVLKVKDQSVIRALLTYWFEEACDLASIKISRSSLYEYIRHVSKMYRPNPFHNLQHCASVTHYAFILTRESGCKSYLSPLNNFALLYSAMVHDLDHPGNTNLFEINSMSALAVLYNDQSVLENHHCSCAFELLRKPSADLFHNLHVESQKELRKFIISTILATDMSKHAAFLDEVTLRTDPSKYPMYGSLVVDQEGRAPCDLAEQIFLGRLFLHAADLSGPLKAFDVARKWATLVTAEFNAQVAKEKQLGLPVLSFMAACDERTFIKNEIGFSSFFVLPMWRVITKLFPALGFASVQLENNIAEYKRLQEEIG